jgi:hypothetical protein
MPRFGFIRGTYTSRSRAVADEECINWYVETDESQDGQAAKSFYWTPGLRAFGNPMRNPIRAMYFTGTRLFVVAGTQLMEIDKNGAQTLRGTVVSDSKPASIAGSNIQLFIVSAGSATAIRSQLIRSPKSPPRFRDLRGLPTTRTDISSSALRTPTNSRSPRSSMARRGRGCRSMRFPSSPKTSSPSP